MASARKGRRTAQAVSAAVVALVAVGTWWLQGSGGDDPSSDRPSDRPSDRTSQEAGPTATPAAPSASGGVRDMPSRDGAGIPYVALDDLPAEAAQTVALIDAGGPFPYPDKDGSGFGNFEGLLPGRARGYYAEYTVPTPGESDRGARRIIAGDGGELYWTEDHYESFERIWR